MIPSRQPNILLVDDTVVNLEILAEGLEKRGYRCRPVLTGVQARLQRHCPALAEHLRRDGGDPEPEPAVHPCPLQEPGEVGSAGR